MASEKSLSVSFFASKSATWRKATLSYQRTYDWTGDRYTQFVMALGTSYEAVNKGDVGTVEEVIIRNVDATGNLIVSFDKGATACLTLLPGQWIVLAGAGALTYDGNTSNTEIQLKSSAGTVEAEITIVEA